MNHILGIQSNLIQTQTGQAGQNAQSGSSLRFDRLVSVLSIGLVGGIHLDAWAHHQFEVETFFTPWHGVLYSGFLALAVALIVSVVINLRRGYPWREAIPAGYTLSLLGIALFMAGGLGDMLWHVLFGIEVDIEALLSPTHLLLALGGALLVTGPLRAAWRRPRSSNGWADLLPALISLALLLSVFVFFTAYTSPVSEAIMAEGMQPDFPEPALISQAVGVAGILLHAGLITGLVLLVVRRWALPFGSIALVFTIQTLLSVSVHETFYLLPFAFLTGLATDLLLLWLKPSAKRPGQIRLFAFSVPVIYFTFYFVTLMLWGGVWWTVHMWAGAVFMAGITGWLLSYLVIPPQSASAELYS